MLLTRNNTHGSPHYYPYDMMIDGGTQEVQPFKYSGKELGRMNGLNWYDHGARMSDPALCRWHVMDPLCEKYYDVSPYAMCGNNPVKFVDKDGREIWIYYTDKEGNQQSFQYSVGMKCEIDNEVANNLVNHFNELSSNDAGLSVVNAIIKSDTKYGFTQSDTHSENGEGYLDMSTNTTYLNDANNTLTFAEEVLEGQVIRKKAILLAYL